MQLMAEANRLHIIHKVSTDLVAFLLKYDWNVRWWLKSLISADLKRCMTILQSQHSRSSLTHQEAHQISLSSHVSWNSVKYSYLETSMSQTGFQSYLLIWFFVIVGRAKSSCKRRGRMFQTKTDGAACRRRQNWSDESAEKEAQIGGAQARGCIPDCTEACSWGSSQGKILRLEIWIFSRLNPLKHSRSNLRWLHILYR